jgi:8-oxo-dGTP diphosphatase
MPVGKPGLTRTILPQLSCDCVEPPLIRDRLASVPPVSVKVILVAACALIDADGRVLIAQRPDGRPMAGLWEFPGGKVEAGERPEESLIRELKEELGIVVNEACLAPLTFASHAYADFHLLMPLYVCRRWEGTVAAQEGQSLAWVRPNRLRDYPMPPADEPLVSHLMGLL